MYDLSITFGNPLIRNGRIVRSQSGAAANVSTSFRRIL
jgi:hypothetical protein